MQPVEKRVLAMTIIGHALCHIYVLILPSALKTIAANLAISLTALTSIGTVSYFLFGVGAFPAGLFAGRTNAKLTLKLFFLLSAVASVVTGISKSLNLFAVGLGMLGLFGSLYHVSGLTLISQCVAKKGRAMGIHGVAGSIGIMSAPLITSVIVELLGWREVYFIMAIPGILGFVFLMFDKTIPNAHVIPKTAAVSDKPNKSVWIMFSIAVIVMGLNGFVYRGFMTMLPTYIAEKVTIGNMSSVLTGGILSTIVLSIGIFGQYLGGHFSDRMSLFKLYGLAFLFSMPFMFFMGFTQNFLLIGAALVFSFFHFSVQPVENHMISKLMPPRLVSSAYGVKFLFTFGVGSFAAGFAGYITDNYSIATLFPILGVIICISVLVVGILVKLDREKE